MRLIDADALIDDLELMYEHRDDKDEPYNIGVRGAINMTRKAPTIEPKRGKWIAHPTEKEWDVCTVCGTGCKRREIGYDAYFKRPYVKEYGYPFCPNCGAMMKGADDE